MPKRGSDLIKYIFDALYNRTYKNLYWVDRAQLKFCLKCTHGGNKDWSEADSQIFLDWAKKKPRRNSKKNENSEARQRFLAAMTKCLLLKQFKKESTVSHKVYQIIELPTSDAENASDEVSDCPSTPDSVMDNVDYTLQIQLADGSSKTMSINDLKLGLQYKNMKDLDITIVKLQDSSQEGLDPKFLTDGKKEYTPPPPLVEDPLSVSMSSAGITDKMLADAVAFVMNDSSVKTEGVNSEILNVDNNYETGVPAATTPTWGNEIVQDSSFAEVPAGILTTEPAAPPVQLYICGGYVIGLAKISNA